MALDVKVGSFVKSTTTAGFPFTQDITDVGFQPKCIIFWSNYQTATGLAEGNDTFFGFTSGSGTDENAAGAFVSADNVATTSNRKGGRQSCIARITPADTWTVDIVLSSFLSNGFRLSYNANTSDASVISYLALGGSDITDAKVGWFVGPTANGTQNITDPGFQPDLVCMFRASGGTTGAGSKSGHAALPMGWGRASTQRWASDIAHENGKTTPASNNDAWRVMRADKIIESFNASNGAVEASADLTGMTSTGFDLNWTSFLNQTFYYLAIKGIQCEVGTFNVTASTGSQTITLSGSQVFTPKAVLLSSIGSTTNTAVQSHARRSIGAADDASNMRATFIGNTSEILNTVTASSYHDTDLLNVYTEAATATSSTLEVKLDITSFASDQFIINRVTNTGTLGTIQVGYVAFGPSLIQHIEKTLATETITVGGGTIAKLATKIRTGGTQTTTLSDSRTRLAAKNRAIATQTTTIGAGTAARVKGKVKTLTTETITVGENRARLGTKLRPIAAQTTTLSESVARVKTPFGGGPADMSEVAAKTYANKFITKV